VQFSALFWQLDRAMYHSWILEEKILEAKILKEKIHVEKIS
jgi:hypothetical protein